MMSSSPEKVKLHRSGTQLTSLPLDQQHPEHSLHTVDALYMLSEWVPLLVPADMCVSQGSVALSGVCVCVWAMHGSQQKGNA